MPGGKINPASKELPSIAAERIREMIVAENMRSGDKFHSESELIAMFGVSRSTVREAVKLLVAENVLEIKRGRGTFITDRTGVAKDPLGLTFSDRNRLLESLLETRLLIEPGVAALAAKRAQKADISRVKEIHEAFFNAVQGGCPYAQYDIDFHSAIAESTQNDVLSRFVPVICESILTGYRETVTVEGSRMRAYESHARIIYALENKFPDLAKREMERHILMTADDANITLQEENNR